MFCRRCLCVGEILLYKGIEISRLLPAFILFLFMTVFKRTPLPIKVSVLLPLSGLKTFCIITWDALNMHKGRERDFNRTHLIFSLLPSLPESHLAKVCINSVVKVSAIVCGNSHTVKQVVCSVVFSSINSRTIVSIKTTKMILYVCKAKVSFFWKLLSNFLLCTWIYKMSLFLSCFFIGTTECFRVFPRPDCIIYLRNRRLAAINCIGMRDTQHFRTQRGKCK